VDAGAVVVECSAPIASSSSLRSSMHVDPSPMRRGITAVALSAVDWTLATAATQRAAAAATATCRGAARFVAAASNQGAA
jgi:hypothetical protein